MFAKKRIYIQQISPKAIFTILLCTLIVWILARPLQAITKWLYFQSGSFVSNITQFTTSIKSNTSDILSSKALIKEQSDTIAQFRLKIYQLENMVRKNGDRNQILNLQKKINFKTITASVIGRSPDSWHKQIIIDKGTKAGIMTGDAAISPNGIVGQIIEVNGSSSTIELVSDPNFRLGCRIQNKNKDILGILSGKNNFSGTIEFIPVGTKIKTGDIVKTSGIKSLNSFPAYPPGFPIGEVSRISKKKNKASDLYVEVKLFEDLTSLSEVLVFSPV